MTPKPTLSRRDALKLTAGAAAAASLSTPSRRTHAQDRAKVRIWSPGDNGTVADWAEDPILQAVQEATQTEIEMVKIGFDVYTDQLNAAVASGELPDVIGTVDHGAKTIIGQWVRDEVVTPYEGEVGAAAPNVLAQYEANPTLAELKIDDKIYMKPVSWGDGNEPNMGLLHVRKDLLDAYGLTPPETFEEYFEYLRAAKAAGSTGVIFTAGGDGGVGVSLNAFAGAYGLPVGGWVKGDTGYGYWATQPRMKEALLLFRRMVAEELIDPTSWEISVGDEARARYVSGEAASYIFNGGGHIGRIQNDLTLVDPAFQEYLLPALDAGAGARGYMAEPMFYGGTFVGTLGGNDPVAAARVINYLSTEEGYKLTALGIAGRDYDETNGQITLNPDQRAQDGFPTEAGDSGAHPLATAVVSWVPLEWQEFSLLYGKDENFTAFYTQMRANQIQYQTPSAGLLTTSALWTDFQSTGSELVARSFLEIVRSGSESDATAAFDQFVSAWEDAGGGGAQTEMSEVLTAIYG